MLYKSTINRKGLEKSRRKLWSSQSESFYILLGDPFESK